MSLLREGEDCWEKSPLLAGWEKSRGAVASGALSMGGCSLWGRE